MTGRPLPRRRRCRLALALALLAGGCLTGSAPAGATPVAPPPGAATGAGMTVTPTYGLPYRQLTPYVAQPPTPGALESDGPENRYTLGGTWLYRADPEDLGISEGFWRPGNPTSEWSEVGIPNAWNAGDYTAAGFAGAVGWYRRDFTVPAHAFARYVPRAARRWVIQFESVNYSAEVWLNGHLLGTHAGAYLPFEFSVGSLRRGSNTLVIRVDDTHTATTLPAGPQSGWWNFGGILDAVYLRPVAEANLDAAVIRPVLACPHCAAQIEEQATVTNPTARPETVALNGRYGPLSLHFGAARIPAGGVWRPSATATLTHPRLWAPGHPFLYPATLTLSDAHGRRLGGYRYASGVREISWRDGLLYLNGEQLHLRGVSIHEQTVQTGAALSVAQQRQLLTWAHALGADIIREHYPLDPEAEQMADEDGILLWSEIPVYGSFLSQQQNDANLSSPNWRAAAARLLADNITTNENHPSILVWSIANELPATATRPEISYIKTQAAEAHRLDPTRPVGMAVEDWPGIGCQPVAYAPLDVIGINEYFGWFDENAGATADRQALEPFLQSVRACYPNKVLMVTEVGYGGDRNGPVEVRGTYQYQDDMLSYSMGVFDQLDWLAGAIWFPMQDFAAEPGYDGGDPIGNPPFVDKGVLNQYGQPKPSFQVMSTLYHGTAQVGASPP
jgi:beta-glucuronidase